MDYLWENIIFLDCDYLYLAYETDLYNENNGKIEFNLDIVPLLETINDLENADNILEKMLSNKKTENKEGNSFTNYGVTISEIFVLSSFSCPPLLSVNSSMVS